MKEQTSVVRPEQATPSPLSAQELINEAKAVWVESQNLAARNNLLLDAAQQYYLNRDNTKAMQLLYVLRDDVTLPAQRISYDLLLAELYFDDPKVGSKQIVELLYPLSSDEQERMRQYRLLAMQYAKSGQWLLAANALVNSNENDEQTVRQAWEWVKTYQSDNTLSAVQPPSANKLRKLQPYLVLGELIKEYGFDTSELDKQLQNYQQVYRGHPLVTYWPQELVMAGNLNQTAVTSIVALLPLSGRLETTGMAIKEGILSAYYRALQDADATPPVIRFIDTTSTSTQQIIEQVQNTQWVIGPLLKETVEQVAPLLPANVKMLALNRIDSASGLSSETPLSEAINKAYFALAPEDEATQLASEVFAKGFRAPVVVTSNNSINQRMKDAFFAKWKALSANQAEHKRGTLTLVEFEDSNSLKEGITQALDVAQSKDRIREIENIAEVPIYNLPRSRKDIDSIVVFASPDHMELLNPMIEASLSPYSNKQVPVYATSRSIDYEKSRNQWRDLQDVRFIEMPWLLPDNDWPDITAESNELWPQRSTSLKRLFAFGVDAYHLLPSIDNLLALPQLSVKGLTGNLAINSQGDVIRTLPQATINNAQITPLAD